MDDFIMSPNFAGFAIVILVILGIIYALIVTIEAKAEDDFDPVIEAKCKKCICHDMCHKHGTDYECRDYMTEEMLQKRGMIK